MSWCHQQWKGNTLIVWLHFTTCCLGWCSSLDSRVWPLSSTSTPVYQCWATFTSCSYCRPFSLGWEKISNVVFPSFKIFKLFILRFFAEFQLGKVCWVLSFPERRRTRWRDTWHWPACSPWPAAPFTAAITTSYWLACWCSPRLGPSTLPRARDSAYRQLIGSTMDWPLPISC